MKMYIPSIGDHIQLTSDWSFTLRAEQRNESLGIISGNFTSNATEYGDGKWSDGYTSYGFEIKRQPNEPYVSHVGRPITTLTFPKGTILSIDRIYIRKGAKEFSSITFHLLSKEIFGKVKGKVRFWVKLDEVNGMEFEQIPK